MQLAIGLLLVRQKRLNDALGLQGTGAVPQTGSNAQPGSR
jgi:hypothetical protein